jgi:hypothetical protein
MAGAFSFEKEIRFRPRDPGEIFVRAVPYLPCMRFSVDSSPRIPERETDDSKGILITNFKIKLCPRREYFSPEKQFALPPSAERPSYSDNIM